MVVAIQIFRLPVALVVILTADCAHEVMWSSHFATLEKSTFPQATLNTTAKNLPAEGKKGIYSVASFNIFPTTCWTGTVRTKVADRSGETHLNFRICALPSLFFPFSPPPPPPTIKIQQLLNCMAATTVKLARGGLVAHELWASPSPCKVMIENLVDDRLEMFWG